jgi:hypothetical protein
MLRHVDLDGFQLLLWATDRTDNRGCTVLGYQLTDKDGSTLFEGEDFCGSPMHGDDSDDMLRCLIGFLTLRPGDTDDEYFENYTAAQHDFAASDAENLSIWADEGDSEYPAWPFVNLDGFDRD